jgi:signal transduction histidine kinase
VLFRKVWREGERYIQGLLLEQQTFLDGVIRDAFRDTALAGMSDLIVAYRGEVFAAFRDRTGHDYPASAAQLRGALLYQTRLSAPLGDMQLIFSVTRLPAGPGARVLGWVTVVLVLVLCGGFYLLYRLGAGQIALARQQQDFVSAVSHELKTPLTSIRMYSEMLREGWAAEHSKQSYYAFIHDESERLSRLIGNVLQLARMNRNEVKVDVKPVAVSELIDAVRSPVSSQIERAGFTLRLDCDAAAGRAVIEVDADAFTQILINLVDNAVKFSAAADSRVIDVGCRQQRDGSVMFSVRDYGPGVPRDQMKKIFRLFYRSESELTRETVGTGIGLALVRQLAEAMGGRVDMVNRAPGAEFRVVFPATGQGGTATEV